MNRVVKINKLYIGAKQDFFRQQFTTTQKYKNIKLCKCRNDMSCHYFFTENLEKQLDQNILFSTLKVL